jgi:signal transduction histidine kinase/CheY-like chemotaxis protein
VQESLGHRVLARAQKRDNPSCRRCPIATRVQQTVKPWRKKLQVAAAANRGVSQAALDGATRLEVAGEALRELRAEGSADRIAIWLANDGAEAAAITRSSATPGESYPSDTPAEPPWRGVVWDRESESTPAEWEHLSSAAPFPQDLLLAGRDVEQELAGHSSYILISILMELRKVLWVPVTSRSGLQGVILCGTREKNRTLPRALPLRLAAELALQLSWQDERRVARERHADLALASAVYADLHSGAPAALAGNRSAHQATNHSTNHSTPAGAAAANSAAESALARIADSIVDSRAESFGVGAAFASIALLPEGWSPGDSAARVAFRWKSGDADWLRVAESGAFSATWQEALRTRFPVGTTPHAAHRFAPLARVAALPILAEGQLAGILLVGLFRQGASLSALERLQYRATLAGQAVARYNRDYRASRIAQRQRLRLAAMRESLVALDANGRITDLSMGAAELLGGEAETAAHNQVAARSSAGHLANPAAPLRRAAPSAVREVSAGAVSHALSHALVHQLFHEFFKEQDRAHLADWLARGEAPPSVNRNSPADTLLAELRHGGAVCLRRALPGAHGETVVAIENVSTSESLAERVDGDLALEGVIEWLEEGVVLFDAHDRVRARNTRFEQLAGLGPSESAKGATLEYLISRMAPQAADSARFAERWRNLARGLDGGVRDELRMTQPAARILERAARPVLDAAGHTLGRVEVYRDLTAQRVFQSQLLQTEKLAALGQMVSGVAHELSNPLTSILGYAQRLLLREDGGGRLPEVRQIFQEAERASGILRQLLFSARETPPERRRVSLNQVVMRSMELQRFSMASEKIHMELDLDAALPAVVGDAAQLQQVLMNLVGNARQAIEQKGRGGRIRVRTRQVAERRALLEIEDDGPGVPQSILARIFDPFFTTKAEGVGTGLGLSIVLSIVREHGGSVNVLNAREGGAIFSVALPLAEGLATGPAWPAATLALPSVIGAASGDEALDAMAENYLLARRAPAHGRVLVVEDEPTVARLIADVLQDEGLTVEVLLDGREGLKRAAERRFDLVVCDMRMPGLDGQQFYQTLVRTGNDLQHNFLFVTGDVIAPATQAFLERNRLPHLAKPFRVEELTERARGVLDRRQAPVAALQPVAGGQLPRKSAASKS